MPSARRLYQGHVQGPFNKSAQMKYSAPEVSLEVHAANRLMFGPRMGDLAEIQTKGYDVFMAEQLFPDGIDDSLADGILATHETDTLNENWQQLYDRRSMSSSESRKPVYQVRNEQWIRMIYSKRQLFERVVDFWMDHFNVYGWDYIIRSMWPKWAGIFRQHAFGNFRAMLEETAKNVCMLYYLDNYKSTDGGPNENYARELVELHTLGAMNYQVPGGYIDQDVYEISRCLTGWSFGTDSSSSTRGEFLYNHNDHDRFIKLVLGTIYPGDQPPLKDGMDVLDTLAYHPGTARHIAWKMCVHFIDDFPPQSIVDSTAEFFMVTKDDPAQIRKTLAHLLQSDEFKNSRMTKFKRPIDWLVSAVRALDCPYSTSNSWTYLYDAMGQARYSWRTPDGPPDFASYWSTSNNLLQRWNWAFQISSDWYTSSGLDIPAETVVPPEINTVDGLVDFWVARVLGREISDTTRDAMKEFIAEGRSWTLPLPAEQIHDKLPHLAALAVMTPEFMTR
jgi:uncharacterized protein (DUF1800 family)